MKRASQRTAAEYDALADAYDRYFTDKRDALFRDGPASSALEELLAALPSSAAILDCACGAGSLTLSLARRGFQAHGADISPGMVRIARRHARELGINARFTVAGWVQQPKQIRRRFDMILCVGNAIGHCSGEREMLDAVQAMHGMLKPGGALYLDTRCWETYRKERVRFDTFSGRVVQGEHLNWLNVRHYPPRFTDPHLIEVVIIKDRGGDTSVKSYPVTYWPFRRAELRKRLKAVGFVGVTDTFAAGANWYSVTARRG